MSWFSVRRTGDTAHVSIGSDIGCYGADASALLKSIGDAQDVRLTIDSTGGCSVVGTAAYDALRGRVSSATVTGRCCSSAIPILLSAGRRVALPDAKLMIHSPVQYLMGGASELRQSADYLDRLSARWIDILCDDSAADVGTAAGWLSGPDAWFTAQEALAVGLITVIAERSPRPRRRRREEPETEEYALPVTIPADDGKTELLFEMLQALGPIKTTDKKKLARELTAWFATQVQQT